MNIFVSVSEKGKQLPLSSLSEGDREDKDSVGVKSQTKQDNQWTRVETKNLEETKKKPSSTCFCFLHTREQGVYS